MSISKCKLEIERLYLMYVNDFITVSHFSLYHSIDRNRALRIIATGRKLNHKGYTRRYYKEYIQNFEL